MTLTTAIHGNLQEYDVNYILKVLILHNCIYNLFIIFIISHINVECNNEEIRLVGGESSDEGRLEICYNDIWTPVCVTYFHDEEAAVACKQLGYTHYSCTYVTLSLNKFIISLYYRGFYIHCWKYTTGQAIYHIWLQSRFL